MRVRVGSLVILFAILLQLCGTGLIYALQIQALHKAQMERIAAGKFNHKEQVILNLKPHELTWVKAHEFIYKGYMYDVVSVAEINGEWQVAALKDEREDKVRAQLNEPYQHEHPTQGLISLKLTNLVYVVPEILDTSIKDLNFTSFYWETILSHELVSQPICSPPPEA